MLEDEINNLVKGLSLPLKDVTEYLNARTHFYTSIFLGDEKNVIFALELYKQESDNIANLLKQKNEEESKTRFYNK